MGGFIPGVEGASHVFGRYEMFADIPLKLSASNICNVFSRQHMQYLRSLSESSLKGVDSQARSLNEKGCTLRREVD
jgi:hypothetical protein